MKGNYDENIDKNIKQCLKYNADKVSVPDGMFFKVRNEILKKEEKGVWNMKIKFLNPKTLLIAGIVCVLTTVTCVAATNLSGWYGSSSTLNDIKTFPSEELVQKEVGFVPKYVESFSNGFKFDTFNYSDNEKRNEEGKTIAKSRSAEFYYKKDGDQNNKSLSIDAEKIDEQYIEPYDKENLIKDNYKGIEIDYISNKYKAVPDGYELSEEEKELCDKGLLEIGYGSPEDEICEYNMQYVSWYEDGILYSIVNFDYDDLAQNDMINMAKEIIDQK